MILYFSSLDVFQNSINYFSTIYDILQISTLRK